MLIETNIPPRHTLPCGLNTEMILKRNCLSLYYVMIDICICMIKGDYLIILWELPNVKFLETLQPLF